MNKNYFESPFKGIPLSEQVTNPRIIVGRYSYYSGYYHGHSFDDCARYLLPEDDADKLIIGSFCSIGTGAAFIMAGNQGHRMDWVSSFPFYFTQDEYAKGSISAYQKAGDTVIGHDVWIGAEAMIMPGVQIGNGAVIGARALITKDVEPYNIVAGNPAKIIRKRFTDDQINLLQELAWWHWSEKQLQCAMPLLCSQDIEGLYKFWLDEVKIFQDV